MQGCNVRQDERTSGGVDDADAYCVARAAFIDFAGEENAAILAETDLASKIGVQMVYIGATGTTRGFNGLRAGQEGDVARLLQRMAQRFANSVVKERLAAAILKVRYQHGFMRRQKRTSEPTLHRYCEEGGTNYNSNKNS